MSALEDTLAGQLRLRGVNSFVRESMFHSERKWRADFMFPRHMLICEVQGGTWASGAHSRGKGQRRDAEKQNAAVMMGYAYMVFTSDMIRDETAADTIAEYLKGGA